MENSRQFKVLWPDLYPSSCAYPNTGQLPFVLKPFIFTAPTQETALWTLHQSSVSSLSLLPLSHSVPTEYKRLCLEESMSEVQGRLQTFSIRSHLLPNSGAGRNLWSSGTVEPLSLLTPLNLQVSTARGKKHVEIASMGLQFNLYLADTQSPEPTSVSGWRGLHLNHE